jgi:2'-5' RNA ligase
MPPELRIATVTGLLADLDARLARATVLSHGDHMTLPENMIDRWAQRHDPAPGERTLYWHVLMADQPDVVYLARQAAERLAPFAGLHQTPLDRLHMTTLLVGSAESFSNAQRERMIQTAAEQLADVPPITVSLGKIFYYPEVITITVTPGAALAPLRRTAIAATRAAGRDASDKDGEWRPHVTLCYSTSDQPARPIIDALGTALPEKTVTVRRLSLVIQTGSELAWDWTIAGWADLAAPVPAQPARSSR